MYDLIEKFLYNAEYDDSTRPAYLNVCAILFNVGPAEYLIKSTAQQATNQISTVDRFLIEKCKPKQLDWEIYTSVTYLPVTPELYQRIESYLTEIYKDFKNVYTFQQVVLTCFYPKYIYELNTAKFVCDFSLMDLLGEFLTMTDEFKKTKLTILKLMNASPIAGKFEVNDEEECIFQLLEYKKELNRDQPDFTVDELKEFNLFAFIESLQVTGAGKSKIKLPTLLFRLNRLVLNGILIIILNIHEYKQKLDYTKQLINCVDYFKL